MRRTSKLVEGEINPVKKKRAEDAVWNGPSEPDASKSSLAIQWKGMKLSKSFAVEKPLKEHQNHRGTKIRVFRMNFRAPFLPPFFPHSVLSGHGRVRGGIRTLEESLSCYRF